MDRNIILELFIKIGVIVILIISQIISYKYAKANSPEAKVENNENSLTIKIYSPNRLVFYMNQILFPIIIVIFSLCISDIIYLLTDYKLNIFAKIISIIIFLFIAYIIYMNIKKKSIRKNNAYK